MNDTSLFIFSQAGMDRFSFKHSINELRITSNLNIQDKHKESAASKVVATIPEDKQMEDEATAADARAYSGNICIL